MKRFSCLNIAIFFIILSSLLPAAFPSPAHADSAQGSLQELTQAADSIVVGTVTEQSSYWNKEHTKIYTSVVLSVEDNIKGEPATGSVTVIVPGGTVGEIGEWVSDAATFNQGEKAVVFLKKPDQPESSPGFSAQQFEVYQGFKGKFPVKEGKIDSLPVNEFKGRLNSILSGRTLSATELDMAPSLVTMPYSAAPFHWPFPPTPLPKYYINANTSDCTGEDTVVRTAASTWSGAVANFSFGYAGPTTATAYSQNYANEIIWRDRGDSGALATTYVWYMGSTIVECDVEFNDYYSWSTATTCPSNRYDVETVGLHELGHWLCLYDLYNPGDSAKVMYGYGSMG